MERTLNPKILIFVLVLIIVILSYVLIYYNSVSGFPPEAEKTSVEKFEREIAKKQMEINLWKASAELLQENANILEAQVDSLNKLKQKVKIQYREVYTIINNNASNNELDSVIRSNW
jgi:hypothetical protein